MSELDYDAHNERLSTCSRLRDSINQNALSGLIFGWLTRELNTSDDDSVEVFVDPAGPAGFETNRVKSVPPKRVVSARHHSCSAMTGAGRPSFGEHRAHPREVT